MERLLTPDRRSPDFAEEADGIAAQVGLGRLGGRHCGDVEDGADNGVAGFLSRREEGGVFATRPAEKRLQKIGEVAVLRADGRLQYPGKDFEKFVDWAVDFRDRLLREKDLTVLGRGSLVVDLPGFGSDLRVFRLQAGLKQEAEEAGAKVSSFPWMSWCSASLSSSRLPSESAAQNFDGTKSCPSLSQSDSSGIPCFESSRRRSAWS